MKRGYVIPALCVLSLLFLPVSALAQCNRSVGQRLDTARALVTLEQDNYESRINYWAEDIVYKEPVLTNNGRAEMLEYLDAVFGGTLYGFPDDRAVEIKDELYVTHGDGSMTYTATVQWDGTFGYEYFFQTGMSIVKFSPGEGCASYQRDYWTEGDTWWNVPEFQPQVMSSRNIYILLFGLTGRCFDEDEDGYTKYSFSNFVKGKCLYKGLDCNDFRADINPGATEIGGNHVDDDCDGTID